MKKFFLLIVFSVISINTFSQVFQFSNDHISFIVKDIDKSAKFYSDVLQLQKMETPVGMPETVRWFKLSDGTEIHITETKTKFKAPQKEIHYSLSTVNLLEFINLLVTKKIAFEDWFGEENKTTTRSDGVKQIYFQDPDGYWIEVNTDVK